MGLFNKKKKEFEDDFNIYIEIIKDDFNYEETLKKAKLYDIFNGSELDNVINTQNKYEKNDVKTGLAGIFDKNNKLILVLKYNLEQKIVFDYLLYQEKSLDYIYDKIEVSPLTIESKDETLLSNYSDSEILRYIKNNSNISGTYLEYTINKALYKEYMKEDFKEFKKIYKVLADKMRPMVYELGFLKKIKIKI